MMKKCLSCNEAKPISAFAKNKAKHDGLQYRCRECWAVYRTANRESILEQKREHYASNRERLLAEKRTEYAFKGDAKRAYQREYAVANKDAVSTKNKLFYLKNPDYYKNLRKRFPGKLSAKENKRKAAKIQRTPAWLTDDDHWMIEQAYELSALRTRIFGFPWHVDHVVPLQGKLVSGLHTPYNLQVIPGAENVRKSNLFKV